MSKSPEELKAELDALDARMAERGITAADWKIPKKARGKLRVIKGGKSGAVKLSKPKAKAK